MEELFWMIASVALVGFAMSLGGRGKRRRRPRWTSSSDIDRKPGYAGEAASPNGDAE